MRVILNLPVGGTGNDAYVYLEQLPRCGETVICGGKAYTVCKVLHTVNVRPVIYLAAERDLTASERQYVL